MKTHVLRKSLALLLVFSLLIACFAGCGKKEEPVTTAAPTTTTTEPPTTEPVSAVRNPLTGELGYDEELLNNRPIFVSVENHPDARPQWGITSSDMVFEMVTEGGITRTLQVFADVSRLPDKLGPTRSARYYFVELAEGFGGIFVHFGGNVHAYEEMNNLDTDHIDGARAGGAYFDRDYSRGVATEHTAYTTRKWITKAISALGIDPTIDEGYQEPFAFYDKPTKLDGGDANKVVVSFSSSYTYTYTYNPKTKVYESSLGGVTYTDSDGKVQSFTNLLVLYTDVYPYGDGSKVVKIDLDGGSGKYFSQGTWADITWEKGDYDDLLKFYDADGNDLKLNVGRSYVAFVDSDREPYNTVS